MIYKKLFSLVLLTLFSFTIYGQYTLELVKNINPNGDSEPEDFIVFKDKLFFTAKDENDETHLWVSDGTTAGTHILKKIHNNQSFRPRNFTIYNDMLYFALENYDPNIIQNQMWRTDGTEQGTEVFYNVGFGYYQVVTNDLLYFMGNDDVNGNQLWVTDGTTSGTQLLKMVSPTSSGIIHLTEFNGNIIFYGGPMFYPDLWISDGTESGTQLLKELDSGISSLQVNDFIHFNNKLYFTVFHHSYYGGELWVTDGTTAGTHVVKNIHDDSHDSAPQGSVPMHFTEYNGLLYFSANHPDYGREMWVTDGTEAGTQLFKNIYPGGSSAPAFLTEYDGYLYFSANDGINASQLWKSDGTTGGTQLYKVLDPNGNSSPHSFHVYHDELYFVARDNQMNYKLYVTDGNADNISILSPPISPNPNPMITSIYYRDRFIEYDGAIYFKAQFTMAGKELWRLETEPTTTIVKEINRGDLMSVYPNPSSDLMYVKLTETIESADIQILNLNGQLIHQFDIHQTQEFKLNVNTYPKGNYFLVIRERDRVTVEKILIQ